MRTLQIVAIAGTIAAVVAAALSLWSMDVEVHDNMFVFIRDLKTAGRYAALAAIANAVAIASIIWRTSRG